MTTLTLDATKLGPKISKHLYGHFAEHLGRCIYEGLWVGEHSTIDNTHGFRNDVVRALKKMRIPNLRWPGGCFADTYHWMDGVGPREKRPSIVNIHWGGVTENNHVGTHEFLDLCDQLGCDAYIAGNVGSGTVREMAEWLEYLTMPGNSPMADLRRKHGRELPWDLAMWGVGNENWGCGGNMRPEYYADLFKQYVTYCRNFQGGKKLYKVACGQTDHWNEILMREAGRFMDGLSVHYYTLPGDWAKKGSSTDFDENVWKLTLQKASNIEDFIDSTSKIMDKYDAEKRVGIVMDEWGTWYDVEPGTNPGFLYQQNTMRDALVAGLSLNIFNRHADRVQVANIAQTVNVLQAVALTDGPKMVLTPTYHVFEMYAVHQDATLLPTTLSGDEYVPGRKNAGAAGAGDNTLSALSQVSASASRDAGGKVHLTLCNLHHADAAEVSLDLRGVTATTATGRVLTAPAMNTMNTFDAGEAVTPKAFDGVKADGGRLTMTLPSRSVVALELA